MSPFKLSRMKSTIQLHLHAADAPPLLSTPHPWCTVLVIAYVIRTGYATSPSRARTQYDYDGDTTYCQWQVACKHRARRARSVHGLSGMPAPPPLVFVASTYLLAGGMQRGRRERTGIEGNHPGRGGMVLVGIRARRPPDLEKTNPPGPAPPPPYPVQRGSSKQLFPAEAGAS
jgi:hypothetical protein